MFGLAREVAVQRLAWSRMYTRRHQPLAVHGVNVASRLCSMPSQLVWSRMCTRRHQLVHRQCMGSMQGAICARCRLNSSRYPHDSIVTRWRMPQQVRTDSFWDGSEAVGKIFYKGASSSGNQVPTVPFSHVSSLTLGRPFTEYVCPHGMGCGFKALVVVL